jgi:glycosyltransferase involved in cell wall biosynthesis
MKHNEIQCSLILPCYNEQDNLLQLEPRLLKVPDLINGELILVDNGSTDQTASVITQMSKVNPRIIHVSVQTNLGYGNGIIKGIEQARGRLIGWSHSDGQYNLFDAATGFAMLAHQNNSENFLVMGRRRGRRTIDAFFTQGMSIFESVLFQHRFDEITAQPKIMTKSFFESLPTPPRDFSLDLYVYVQAKRRGCGILKFDTLLSPRAHGTSSWNTGWLARIKLIRRTVEYSLRLRFSGDSKR